MRRLPDGPRIAILGVPSPAVAVAVMEIGRVGVDVGPCEMRMLVGVAPRGRWALGVRVSVVSIVVAVPVAVGCGVMLVPVAMRFLREQRERERHQRGGTELDP